MLYIAAFIILVAIFLLGITWMRIGLFNLSGKKLEQWLKKVTNTPVQRNVCRNCHDEHFTK